jgi:cation diffusion facilitator family transporter
MSARQRTALFSVVAAGALVVLKLTVGLVSGSLGLVAEAVHSGTDLVAALLTFLAIRVAVRPADRGHPFGHGKAEHLAALGEGAILIVASGVIAVESISRLSDPHHPGANAAWYTFATIGVVIAVDLSRTVVSLRASRRERSPALASNALHFGSDLLGSTAVAIGLALVRAGYREADSVAALFVAVLVTIAAGRLMRENVGVLMDRLPREAESKARAAIDSVRPGVELRRLRLREAAGRYFADAVIGVRQDAGIGQAHTAADDVERAIEDALPGADVVVHVEPRAAPTSLREQVTAAAMSVTGVREVHNLSLLDVEGRTELSLHLKLPPDMNLRDAHAVASEVERSIARAVPAVGIVHTHIEPLAGSSAGSTPGRDDIAAERGAVRQIVRDLTGRDPLRLEFRGTRRGLVVFLTLALDPGSELEAAHSVASEIEERVRAQHGSIADVVVHTEPDDRGEASDEVATPRQDRGA